jgi:hypothetical protein
MVKVNAEAVLLCNVLHQGAANGTTFGSGGSILARPAGRIRWDEHFVLRWWNRARDTGVLFALDAGSADCPSARLGHLDCAHKSPHCTATV